MLETNKIHCVDCLEGIKKIPDNSVDLVVTDLPYGITQNPNDKVINLSIMWRELMRIKKKNSALIFTCQFPFTHELISKSPIELKYYDLVWNKILTSGFLNVNKMPLRIHENILVFYEELPTYNPQKFKGQKSHSKGSMKSNINRNYGEYGKVDNTEELGNMKFPQSIISFMKPHPSKANHPTEKPVELADYLIKTYSNEGQIILDLTCGTGWTFISCKQLRRNFIGFEINPEYVKIANKRLVQEVLPNVERK